MSGSKKVLIIDDEIDLCLLLKGYLIRKGFDVYLSHSLSEGLGLLDKLQPEILFLDNNLPDGIGWSLAPQLAVTHPTMYQVLISAFHPTLPEMPPNAHYRHIEKPISISDLDIRFSDINGQ